MQSPGRKPVLRNLLKTCLASAQGTAQETQRWTLSVSHAARKGEPVVVPEEPVLTSSDSQRAEAGAAMCPRFAVLQTKSHDFDQLRFQ